MTYLKIDGTQKDKFSIGYHFSIDASQAGYTWKLPASNGTPGYVLSNDGSGNLSWIATGAQANDSTVPYYLPDGEEYIVYSYKQALFSLPISIDGTMILDGILVEV